MNDSQIALAIAATAIVVMAVAMYRQGALGIKGLAGVSVATIGLAAFMLITLAPTQ